MASETSLAMRWDNDSNGRIRPDLLIIGILNILKTSAPAPHAGAVEFAVSLHIILLETLLTGPVKGINNGANREPRRTLLQAKPVWQYIETRP